VAIVDYAAQMSDGICQWMKDNSIKPIVHVTSDADDEMMDWFKTPYLTACRYYSAAETGRVATKAVLDKIGGKAPTFQNDIYQVLMTKDNLAAEVAKAPYYIDEFRKSSANF
jgi:ribose transport system substrate-binding protein